MLPSFQPGRIPRRRVRAGAPAPVSPPPPPPGPPINVNYVNSDDPPSAVVTYWLFDNDLTLDGVPVGLQVFVGGVWLDPVSASQPDATALWVFYDTGETLDGKTFRIV